MRRLKRLGKRASAWLLGALLRLGIRRAGEGGAPRRVLLIRVDLRVGNVLLTTPLIRALQEGLPDADLDVLVAPSKASILEGLVRTVGFDKKLVRRRPTEFLRGLLALRRARYDVAIDASHWHTFSVTSAALLAWSGAPIRIAHGRGAAARFANRIVGPPGQPESELRTKLRLLEPLGIEGPRIEMQTGLGLRAGAQRMGAWLSDRGLGDGPVLGLAPGARKADHRAPAGLFAELGRVADARGIPVLVLWGPGEAALAAEVAEGCGGVVAPDSTLDELAALMRRCSVVVANDTGPMHLAVACGTQTLALFRSADPVRWGHREQGHDVIVFDESAPEETARTARACLERRLDALPRASRSGPLA